MFSRSRSLSQESCSVTQNSEQIKVALHIRPLLESEDGCQRPLIVSKQSPEIFVGDESENQQKFRFDYVLDNSSETGPEVLYQKCISPLIEGVFEGYNTTMLAYGSTGSGKSYLMGTAREYLASQGEWQGIIPHAINDIFARLKNYQDKATKMVVRCSFIEIYQDQIKDLLSPNKQGRIVLREPDPRKDAILEGLMEVQIQDSQDMLDCLYDGLKQRTVGATRMNKLSSRSHAIFTIKLIQTKPMLLDVGEEGNEVQEQRNEVIEGKIQFVDLAGSERLVKSGAEGAIGKVEACTVNKGLLAVGNVVEALCKARRRHIPYRDHILTRVLRTSLGGNCRTVMIACISPTDVSLNETVSTLSYAERARNICNNPVANRAAQNIALVELRNENNALKDQILMLQARVRNNEDLTEEDFSSLKVEIEEERSRRLVLEQEIAVLKGQLRRERGRNKSLENQIEAIKHLAIKGYEAEDTPFNLIEDPDSISVPAPPPCTPRDAQSTCSGVYLSHDQTTTESLLDHNCLAMRTFHSYNAFSSDVPHVQRRPSTYSRDSRFSDDDYEEQEVLGCGEYNAGQKQQQSQSEDSNQLPESNWDQTMGRQLPQEILDGEKVIVMDQNARFSILEQQNSEEMIEDLKSNPYTIINGNKLTNAMLWQQVGSVEQFVSQIVQSCCQQQCYQSIMKTHHDVRVALLKQIQDMNQRLEQSDPTSSGSQTLKDHMRNLQNKVLEETKLIEYYNKISLKGRQWEDNYIHQSSQGGMWDDLNKRDLIHLVHHLLSKAVELCRSFHVTKDELAYVQNEAILAGRLYEHLKDHLIARGYQISVLEARLEKICLANQSLDIWAGQRQRAVEQKVWAYSQLAQQQEEMENLRFQVSQLTCELEELRHQIDDCPSSYTPTEEDSTDGKRRHKHTLLRNIIRTGSGSKQHECDEDDFSALNQEKMDALVQVAQLQQENFELRVKLDSCQTGGSFIAEKPLKPIQ
eukprot:TRINITY_DN3892_c1_g1_i1.p1 TRINITY_DN3892_c1_g1~~TRINITY_DN3892_c1_g1_i1.p1  ORF type:complete len:978 (-),score=114.62 TRINITY_DN3892_c1_g1_i1:409-3342(-)